MLQPCLFTTTFRGFQLSCTTPRLFLVCTKLPLMTSGNVLLLQSRQYKISCSPCVSLATSIFRKQIGNLWPVQLSGRAITLSFSILFVYFLSFLNAPTKMVTLLITSPSQTQRSLTSHPWRRIMTSVITPLFCFLQLTPYPVLIRYPQMTLILGLQNICLLFVSPGTSCRFLII